MIFIPENVPSLKNSKIKTSKGIFPSKTVKKYLQKLGIQKYSVSKKEVVGYATRENLFIKKFKENNWKKPLNQAIIEFHFVRGSKHKFDFHNAVQILADLMVAHDLIEDDNMDYFIPFPMKKNNKWYSYDKKNPGVYIKIKNK
jgi:chlorite dismutase